MKKYCFILLLFLAVLPARAQQPHKINSYFMDNGAVGLETEELRNDTVVTIFHRREDVVWSRTVYSIIDLRYKQNFELYFPTNMDNTRFRSLMGVIVDAVVDGVPVFYKTEDLDPHLENPNIEVMSKKDIEDATKLDPNQQAADASEFSLEEFTAEQIEQMTQVASLIRYDAASDKLMARPDVFTAFVKNQFKFMVQEQIFFDKHYSRLYRCIIAVAPMYAVASTEEQSAYDAVNSQIMFWVPFQALRPYLQRQYMITSRNSTKRMTYDAYFAQRQYSSYIVGENNMYDRVIPEYVRTEKQIKQEQERIATELLNFEQDLWEY